MATVIRAVYEQGRLRPLDPVRLTDGQEVQVAILSDAEQVRSALGSLVAPAESAPVDILDEADVLAAIDAALPGTPGLSAAILEDRRDGP